MCMQSAEELQLHVWLQLLHNHSHIHEMQQHMMSQCGSRGWKQAQALCKSIHKWCHLKPGQLALPEVDVILLMCIKAS